MTDQFRAMCAELLADYDNCHYRSELSDRARALLAQPVAEVPTTAELMSLSAACNSPSVFARAVLARWGRPTPQPVAVSERLPGPEDCDPLGNCWAWDTAAESWNRTHYALCNHFTHWLPSSALPLPVDS